MTAHPVDPESRRNPLCIAVALVLVMVAVLLAAGCVSQITNETSLNGTVAQSPVETTPILDITETPADIPDASERSSDLSAEFSRQQENAWQKMISEELHAFNKSNFSYVDKKVDTQIRMLIHFGSDTIPDSQKVVYYSMSSEEAKEQFGVSNLKGDLVQVDIELLPDTPIHTVDPFTVRVSGNLYNHVYAWVELTNLEKIASLKCVRQIHLVRPPVFSSGA